MKATVKKVARLAIERAGYELVSRQFLRFGYDPFQDIKRLSERWGYQIRTFFDVGANDGETTLKARQEFPDADILAFEPHPATFAALMQKVGHTGRFRGFDLALAAEAGEANMFEYDSSTINSLASDARYAKRFDRASRHIQVKCSTIDLIGVKEGLDRIDVLKIDTEGYDLEVLKGAAHYLAHGRIKFIYTEFNDIHPLEGTTGGSLAPIDLLLHPHGYRFVASYNDYIVTEGEFFAVSNALFALPPKRS